MPDDRQSRPGPVVPDKATRRRFMADHRLRVLEKRLIGAPSRLNGGLLRGGMIRGGEGCGGPGSEVVSNTDVQNELRLRFTRPPFRSA